jgi:hypothetical protein
VRQRLRRASIGADTPQRCPPEDDGAVVEPDTGTPQTARDPVQDCNRIAAGQRNLLQEYSIPSVEPKKATHPPSGEKNGCVAL